jgi:membrane-associated phospholipid phosphatase
VHWGWIALGYVTYLGLVSLTRPAFRPARKPALGAAAIGWALAALASTNPVPQPPAVSTLLPGVVLLIGYRLSGCFFVAPDFRVERWLSSVDRIVLERSGILDRLHRAPGVCAEWFELSYLLVYAVIPCGAITLAASGHFAQVERYWSTVLLAEFACYGMLPWIQTRPPRVLESPRSPSAAPLRRLNLGVVGRVSIHANTVPSGHAAGAVAAALALWGTMPVAGALFLAVAASVTVATVTGRYHYTVDAVAGVVVGFMGFVGS